MPDRSRLAEALDIDLGLALAAEPDAHEPEADVDDGAAIDPPGGGVRAISRAGARTTPVTPRARRVAAAGSAAPLLLLVTGAMLGTSTTLAKLAADVGLPPLAFLAWSCAGAALLSLLRAAARRTLPPLNARTAEYFVCAAFFTVAAPNLILFSAVAHVGAALVATTIALPALLTYAGALAFGLERFRALRVAGVALALAGTASIAMLEIAMPQAPTRWIAFVLVAPMLFACGNLYRTLRWPTGLAAETLLPGMLVAAAAMLFAADLVPLPGLSIVLPLDRGLPLALIGVQTLVFTGQFLFLLELQRRGGPVYLSLIGPVGALVGVLAAVLLLGESAPRGLGAGAACIALGVALLSVRGGDRHTRGAELAPAGEARRRGSRRRRSSSPLGRFAPGGALRRRWRRGLRRVVGGGRRRRAR